MREAPQSPSPMADPCRAYRPYLSRKNDPVGSAGPLRVIFLAAFASPPQQPIPFDTIEVIGGHPPNNVTGTVPRPKTAPSRPVGHGGGREVLHFSV